MSKLDVNLYKFDDWQILTVNGEIVYQNHRVEIEEFAEQLGLEDQGINFYSKFIDENDYPELKEYFANGNVEAILEEI